MEQASPPLEPPVLAPRARQALAYRIYGLNVGTDFPLEGLRPLEAPMTMPDVSFKEVSQWADSDGAAGEAGCLQWPGQVEFRWSDSKTIFYRRLGAGDDGLLENFYFHHVLSHWLLGRGVESLHATVLKRNGRAMALLGDSGYGKSSLAAALLGHGFDLVTDDLLVFQAVGGETLCQPGIRRLKLLPDSLEFFNPTHDFAESCNGKTILHFDEEPAAQVPVVISDWYFLLPPESRELMASVHLRALRGEEIFIRLVGNTYNLMVRSRDRLVRQMGHFSRLAKSICAHDLAVPVGLSSVGEAARQLSERATRHE